MIITLTQTNSDVIIMQSKKLLFKIYKYFKN